MEAPRPYFALLLAPTRELALQIAQQLDALGKPQGARTVCLVGGVNLREQKAVLAARKYHIVVGEVSCPEDFHENTKRFCTRLVFEFALDRGSNHEP